MDLRRGLAFLFVAALLALAACEGNGNGPGNDVTDPGTPDVQEVTDPGTEVPEDNGRDTTPESQAEMPVDTCTCATNDECCDGCMPRNEGQACGTANPCQEKGTCQAGACGAPTAKACPAADTCHAGEGTCDTDTGECEYAAKADLSPCEAVAGKDGSGYCLDAVCVGFGVCDHRTYDQSVGSACNFDGECASGRCADWGDGWTTYCTAPCGGTNPACPEGMTCMRSGTEFLCRPNSSGATLPGDASHDTYQVCNHDEDCDGDLCLGIDGKRFCTKSCDDGTGAASEDLCGDCGDCRDGGTDLGFKYEFYCTPHGIREVGQPCGSSFECAKRFCQNGLCSEQCFVIEDLSSCPENMDCVAGVIASDPTIQVCVPKGEAGHGYGEPCLGDYACTDGRKCLAVLGQAICTTECSEEAPCADGICTETANGNYCVPSDLIGGVTQGQECQESFQCAEGYLCFQNACMKGCEADADCGEGGSCVPDAMVQAYYCTTACSAEVPCPPRMGCFQGRCMLTMDGQVYPNGTCRVDADCESGLCISGTCSEECSETLPCEGSEPITPVEKGMCQPCDPNLYDADCNEIEYGMNQCLQGIDGQYFCAIDCTMVSICPVGTRCYSTGWLSACVPITFSCNATMACTSTGHCVRPVEAGTPCSENAECASGLCGGGLCQEAACTKDEDCGCNALYCSSGSCLPAPSFGLVEVEPNDTAAQAQVLASGTERVSAILFPTGSLPDVDLFKVHLAAGQALDVRTQPFCGNEIDTNLRLLDATGVPHEGWENDDLDPYGDYSSILQGFLAFQEQDVLVEVTQSPLVGGMAKFAYALELDVFQVGSADTCEGAQTLANGSYPFDLADSVNTYVAPSCTGYAAIGKDSAFKVSVPKDSVLRASLASPFDGQVYVVTDCVNADATCVAGADSVWAAGLEELVWWNRTGENLDVFVIVDSAMPTDDMSFDLTIDVQPVVAPANDPLDEAVVPALVSGETVTGTLVGADNHQDPTAEGCGAKALMGPDVMYQVTLQPGDFLTVDVTKAVGFTPALWLITGDFTVPANCVAAGAAFVSWTNEGVVPVTVWVVVDVEAVDGYGDFQLKALYGPASPTFGPCDSATFVTVCEAAGDPSLITCDATTKRLVDNDCNALCQANGAASGACHVYTTPGYERTACLCGFECTADEIAFQCTEGYYTNCTCGAADPCQWTADGWCNEFCAIEYPDDHFTDPPEDCPTE